VLLVCDQPRVDARVIKRLVTLRSKTHKDIIASKYADTLGVPALFSSAFFRELCLLEDCAGAKSIIRKNRDRVAELAFPGGEIDVDTCEQWEKENRR
jgi:molybdenum cofactor cytidylyltransferase